MTFIFKQYERPIKSFVYPLIILLVGLLAYRITLFQPVIFGDDWEWNVGSAIHQDLQCPTPGPRSLLDCVPLLQYEFFGLNFVAHRIITVLAAMLPVIMLYFLLKQVFPKFQIFILLVCLVFLLYPIDNYRFFSVITVYTNLAYAASFSSVALLIKFARNGRWSIWVFSMIFTFISLSLYEAVAGFLIATSFLVFLVYRKNMLFQNTANLGPAILTIGYSLFRWSIQLSAQNLYGHVTEDIETNPTTLLRRIYLGVRFNLDWSWAQSLQAFFPQLVTPGSHSNLIAILTLLMGYALIISIVVFLVNLFTREPEAVSLINDPYPDYKILLFSSLAGLFIVAVSFFPMILAVYPQASHVTTRIYTLPSVGASLTLVSVIAILCNLLGKTGQSKYLFLIFLTIPVILFGFFTKVNLQKNLVKAWYDQKQIWSQLMAQAPGLRSGTHVIILIPKYEEIMSVPPLQGGYIAFFYALRSFYEDDSLVGYYHEGGLSTLSHSEQGFIFKFGSEDYIMPYKSTLLFEYSPEESILTQIKNVPSGLSQTQHLCTECIQHRTRNSSITRSLIIDD